MMALPALSIGKGGPIYHIQAKGVATAFRKLVLALFVGDGLLLSVMSTMSVVYRGLQPTSATRAAR
jgi:hypothetical protein